MEKVTYKESFSAKLVLRQTPLVYYQAIQDLLSTYRNVKTRISFQKETISFGRKKIGMMRISRKNLSLYLALDPTALDVEKIKFKDVSDKKSTQDVPVKIDLKSKRSLKQALMLLETALEKEQATERCAQKQKDYKAVFYPRSFECLLEQGWIKKYIRKQINGKSQLVEVPMETYQVHFTAHLCYEAKDQAQQLFIISNYANWDERLAVKMNKTADNCFEAVIAYPKGTHLEFKICRSTDWQGVEKGIWKEEIRNHHYVVVDHDLEVEDLIYNFR